MVAVVVPLITITIPVDVTIVVTGDVVVVIIVVVVFAVFAIFAIVTEVTADMIGIVICASVILGVAVGRGRRVRGARREAGEEEVVVVGLGRWEEGAMGIQAMGVCCGRASRKDGREAGLQAALSGGVHGVLATRVGWGVWAYVGGDGYCGRGKGIVVMDAWPREVKSDEEGQQSLHFGNEVTP